MAVHEKLSVLNEQVERVKHHIKQYETILATEKVNAKKAERAAYEARVKRNKADRELKALRKRLATLQNKIKRHPRLVRNYVKQKPFDFLEE